MHVYMYVSVYESLYVCMCMYVRVSVCLCASFYDNSMTLFLLLLVCSMHGAPEGLRGSARSFGFCGTDFGSSPVLQRIRKSLILNPELRTPNPENKRPL